MASSTGASAPVFSYAQAAKGLTPATSTHTTSRNESPAASDKSTKDRAGPDTASNAPIKPSKSRLESDNKQSADFNTARPLPTSSSKDTAERDDLLRSHTSPHADQDEKAISMDGVSSPSQNSQPDEARPSLRSRRTTSLDQSQELAVRDKSVGDKKSKEVEDDWEKVSVPSVAAEKELKAAPIPMVNIWKQRQEAQAAKLKDIQDQQRTLASVSPTQATKHKVASEESKQNISTRDRPANDKEAKPIDNGRNRRDTPARASRPVSQQGEKREIENPPTVGDAQSWPTPENSTADERRKSSSYERVDKPDSKFAVQKSHGKSWVQVPFVPSAKFETQLPPAAARRGGRGGNRGRDSGGRGAHSATQSDKQDASGLMGPPPIPKANGEQDRGRKSEGYRGPRGASDPSSSTRPISLEDSTSAANKQSPTFGKPSNGLDNTMPSASTNQAGEEQGKPEKSSRSSSRNPGNGLARVLNGETNGHVESPMIGAGVGEQTSRTVFALDRSKGSGNNMARGNSEFAKGSATTRNRDWSREKPDSAREKVESWRDRDTAGDQNVNGRREIRSERGRGSGYRGGRGSHSYNSTYGPNHAFTSPLPQNGFEPPRSSSHPESRSRQTSQPFPPTQSTPSNRGNPRSQSIPVQMVNYSSFYNNPQNLPHGLPFLQTDMAYQQLPMQPGIMTAVPYNDPLNSFALMSMVGTQIEYYFSIDNLCKDVFLRKHMDSQGWVPLSVIANFKRIKTLTEDNMTLETVRYVCQTVKSVEFLPGLDGDDRLRRRDNWRDFVFPYEERFESARHEGPIHAPEHYNRSSAHEQISSVEGGFSSNHVRSPPVGVAPTNGIYHTSSPMTYIPNAQNEPQLFNGTFVPPFEEPAADSLHRPSLHSANSQTSNAIKSPTQSAAPPSGMTNGHLRHSSRSDIEAHSFPDENIPNINIRMQPRSFLPSGEGEAQQAIARVDSIELPGGQLDPLRPDQGRGPSLRGGAGSPEQLEKLRKISFGFSNGIPTMDENSIIYFTKDGQETQLPPPRPGQYDQTYLALHDTAFQQKELGVEGALEPLYSFWTDFLADKFNAGMYQQFKETAQSEAQEGNSAGLGHLNRFFAKLLNGPVPVSERLASDMVNLAREDKGSDRPLFQILRGAFRNGATNMKTIKRLGAEFTVEEKQQLDKTG